MSKWMISILGALSLGGSVATALAQEPGATPPPPTCEADARHSQFDFWVGQWDVFIADGRQVGTNTISKTESNCLLVEKWTSVRGNTGTSINYFDPLAEKWVQVWVSADRTIIDIRGGLQDGSMLLKGSIIDTANPAGAMFRGTWTLLDDGRVRQFFELSTDEGQTWAAWFEGFYVRRSESS